MEKRKRKTQLEAGRAAGRAAKMRRTESSSAGDEIAYQVLGSDSCESAFTPNNELE